MSYQSIAALTNDVAFGGRVTACATEQADTFKDDARPDWVALALDVLRGDSAALWAFTRLTASAPGLADTADRGDGTIDQAQVPDADILAGVQANWPTVAGLFYDAEGLPIL